MKRCVGKKQIPKMTTNANTVMATFRRAFTCENRMKLSEKYFQRLKINFDPKVMGWQKNKPQAYQV